MIVEWEATLDCNYQCEYCVNSRNSALPVPIKYEKDLNKVFEFIGKLKREFPTHELFLFGGEPFAHPFIDKIIEKLNNVNMKFIIQTNASLAGRIQKIKEDFQIQVSVHPTQIKNSEKYIANLLKIKDRIRRIDVMYTGISSLKYYSELCRFFDREIIVLVPIADFKFTDFANERLYEYNIMKYSSAGKIFNFEEDDRSLRWEEQMKGTLTYKNKPCIYKDRYVLFSPDLKRYTCSYRENNEICPNDHCFLM